MAFRTPIYWKSMVSRLGGSNPTFATSTTPKMKAYAPAAQLHDIKNKMGRGDFVPVCMALGLIAMSATLGAYTAMHQLARAPNVRAKKSLRETIPEVVVPERVADEADKFIKKSFFRKVAHIQEKDDPIIPDHPSRCEALISEPRVETLKTVGVDPQRDI